jgi:hypothetical protein
LGFFLAGLLVHATGLNVVLGCAQIPTTSLMIVFQLALPFCVGVTVVPFLLAAGVGAIDLSQIDSHKELPAVAMADTGLANHKQIDQAAQDPQPFMLDDVKADPIEHYCGAQVCSKFGQV